MLTRAMMMACLQMQIYIHNVRINRRNVVVPSQPWSNTSAPQQPFSGTKLLFHLQPVLKNTPTPPNGHNRFLKPLHSEDL